MSKTVLRGRKYRILTNPELIITLNKYDDACRWIYNEYIGRWYDYVKTLGHPGKMLYYQIDKELTELKKSPEFSWLNDVSRRSMILSLQDAKKNVDQYVKDYYDKNKPRNKKKGKPKFKRKKDSVNHKSFPIPYVKPTNTGFITMRIGEMKLRKPLPRLRDNCDYHNPRIVYDGKYWYLKFTTEKFCDPARTDGEIVGIDVGLEKLLITSYGSFYENINKTNQKLLNLRKRLKRYNREYSRKLESHIIGYRKGPKGGRKPIYDEPIEDMKNIQKLRQKIFLTYRKINGIIHNYLHQVSHDIVSRTKTKTIVIENLSITNMMKNHHLARSIKEANWYTLLRLISYKSEESGIDIIVAANNYPSSKICSNCGNKKNNLRLSDRIYHCDHCGLTIDRDLNAAINLSKLVNE